MRSISDWQLIFNECKTSIQDKIKPYLANRKEPLPNLGLGAGGDDMKPVDLASETAITQTLTENEVSFTLISEESGIKKFGRTPDACYICVDPIDGTTNLIRGLPFYCTSIAVSNKPDLVSVYAAMVIDLVRDRAYKAFEGQGAYCNDERITTSRTSSLDEAIIGLDVNTYRSKQMIPRVTPLIENTKHIRHFGANALEICYVANGLTDAFIDVREKIRTTDVAAGFLIVKEAGGIVTTPGNRPLNTKLDPKQTLSFVASGNVEIHRKIISWLNP